MPGLAAKPVIDIQVSVASLVPHGRYVDTMATLGYRHIALSFDLVYPFFYRPVDEWPGTHHVHLCEAGGEQEWKHLAFRAHDGTTVQTSRKYSSSKSAFVADVLSRLSRQ